MTHKDWRVVKPQLNQSIACILAILLREEEAGSLTRILAAS